MGCYGQVGINVRLRGCQETIFEEAVGVGRWGIDHPGHGDMCPGVERDRERAVQGQDDVQGPGDVPIVHVDYTTGIDRNVEPILVVVVAPSPENGAVSLLGYVEPELKGGVSKNAVEDKILPCDRGTGRVVELEAELVRSAGLGNGIDWHTAAVYGGMRAVHRVIDGVDYGVAQSFFKPVVRNRSCLRLAANSNEHRRCQTRAEPAKRMHSEPK